MTAEHALDLAREAIRIAILLGAPLLGVALVVGLISGLVQTATQVHEHTLSFVPKLAAVVLTLAAILPWLLARLVEYTGQLIGTISERL